MAGLPALRTVEVDGRPLTYRRAGAGPVLVLLHGAYEDSRIWRRQLADLADAFTVVAFDLPGCGGSFDPPPTWRARDHAACVADAMRALDLDDVTVVGLSFGSVLALALAAHRPECLTRLVLVAAYAGWAGSLTPEQVRARIDQVHAELDQPAATIAAAWMPGLLTPAAPAALRDEVTQILADFHPEGMRAMVAAFGPVDFRPTLAEIAVPTLVLAGERDVRSPPDPVGRAIHEAIPGSRFVVVAGAPHLIMVEMPDAFAAALRAFVAR